MKLSAAPTPDAIGPQRPLTTGSVTLCDGLLGERASANVNVSLPHGYAMLSEHGALDYLRRAAGDPSGQWPPPPVRDKHVEKIYDSDIYKWLEAVAWSWPVSPALTEAFDEIVRLLEAAQQPDGYLHSWVQIHNPAGKLVNWQLGGELYCWGHLFQAAVAASRGAGRDDLLRVATGVAGYLQRSGARAPDGTPVIPTHPGIETALVELYRLTGDREHLELARVFLDRRGYGTIDGFYGSRYFRDDVPVRQATTASGHAVMALYMMAGMIDVAVETGDRELLDVARSQWSDMITRRMYLTGGIGSRHYEEGFGDDYELPPDRAYCETCAAVAVVMAGWRLQLATGDERIAGQRISDVIERVVFNAMLVGVSLAGDTFTYVNPLQIRPHHLGGVNELPGIVRAPWFECACCPPNLMRMLATLAECVASVSPDGVQIHQYTSAGITAPDDDGYERSLSVRTDYPWSGTVRIGVRCAGEREWTLAARIPSWCRSAQVEIVSADGSVEALDPREPGVLRLRRRWRDETVVLTFDLPVRALVADRRIDALRGCVAFQRGPVVYCLEEPLGLPSLPVPGTGTGTVPGADAVHPGHPGHLGHPGTPGRPGEEDVAIRPAAAAAERALAGLLPGAVGLEIEGWRFTADAADGPSLPYRDLGSAPAGTWEPVSYLLVPYFAWGNRGAGPMRVWLPVRHEGGEHDG
jgi:uncharacterized protein